MPALLLAADGLANYRIADEGRVSPAKMAAWRDRFASEGLAKFGQVRKSRGPKPTIPQQKIDEIVELTLHSTPDEETRWSCRSMAEKVGVSEDTVQRVRSARGLNPHLVKTFKVSHDPLFEREADRRGRVVPGFAGQRDGAVHGREVLRASTGPHPAVAADGAGPGEDDHPRLQTARYDHVVATLNVLTGNVIGTCLPRHRQEEFLNFLRTFDREVPKDLAVHI